MGLRAWQSDNIRKTDVAVSKNYLAEQEIREPNRLTTILLDIFEDQLDMGRLVVMQDAQTLLDQQLQQLGRTVLRSGGSTKASDAKRLWKRNMRNSTSSGSSKATARPTKVLQPWRNKQKDCRSRPAVDQFTSDHVTSHGLPGRGLAGGAVAPPVKLRSYSTETILPSSHLNSEKLGEVRSPLSP